MKNFRKTFAASLLLLSSLITCGQKPYLDSINVQIDDNIELSINIYNYTDLVVNVAKDMKILQSILKDNKDIPERVSYSIIYEPNKLLSIKQTEPIEKTIWENGKQSLYKFNNQCNIYTDKYYMKIQYNKIEKLLSDSLLIKIEKVIDTTSTLQGRFSKTYNYSFHEENMLLNKQIDKINGQKDAISLKGGVGVNLIKNQPVIDLSAEIGFMFSKKGIRKNQFYMSYNQLSDFIDDSKVNLNGFANVGYRYNLSNTVINPNWLGIELGYLAIKQGDMLGKHTFRFGVNWEIGKYITITPQLYISGNSTYPAIRIGFGL